MLKYSFFFLLALVFCVSVKAQQNVAAQQAPCHLRISLLTGSAGEELWETFGHTCLRVIDSTKAGAQHDVIYNYGFFEADEDNSIGKQFINGRVKVMLDTITYGELVYEYTIKKRGLVEQVLLLNEIEKAQVLAYLKDNMRKEKRYYDYDTFFDNCTTRVLKLFTDIFGGSFAAGQVLPAGSRLTFRDVSVNTYCPRQYKYWFGLGLNLVYACRTDKVMSNTEAMFLATYLSDGMGKAKLNGRLVCGNKQTLLADKIEWKPCANWPLISALLICVIIVLCFYIKRLHIVYRVLSSMLLIGTGLTGLFLLHMWLIDGEPAWKNNFNLLWAVPINIIIPFLSRQLRAIYGFIAGSLIIIALMVHISGVQHIQLSVIMPIFICLTFIYFIMYKSIAKSITNDIIKK